MVELPGESDIQAVRSTTYGLLEASRVSRMASVEPVQGAFRGSTVPGFAGVSYVQAIA